MNTPASVSRREFLQLTASAAAMLGLAGCAGVTVTSAPKVRPPRPIQPGAKLRIAGMGFNNKGFADIRSFPDEEIVALCDIDWGLQKVQETFAAFPRAKRYKDFRKMLLEMSDQIDALVISTPDHMHFLPAYMAVAMGIHVYVQKPLTRAVWEARELRRLAEQNPKVCTQMGNQGHQMEGIRLVKEWIDADVIGPIREVHIWTNRPIWPQGWTDRPAPQPIPAGLDWELFLGHAPDRPYNIAYHPHDWRGWSEFGAGALGDMGCHTMDAAFYALNLGDPISIQAESPQAVVESFPAWSAITYEFPARGKMPPVKVTWSDGGKLPPRPKDLDAGRALTKSGQYYVGEKGTIFDGQDYCNSPRIIPEARMRQLQSSLPPKTLRRPDPLGNPYLAWTQAIRKGDPEWAGSHFAYSTRLTEFVVFGNFALRAPGKKILWDGAQMAVTNLPELNQFLKPTFRPGWAPLELEKVQRNGTEDLSVPAHLRDGSPGYMKKNQKK